MDPSETNQLIPSLRVYLLSREKVERPHETQQRNRPGFVPGGKIQKKMAFLPFSKSLFLGQSWVVASVQFAQKIPKKKKPATTSNKISRRGLKTRSIMNQPLVLFCAKPLRLPNSMPSRIILHQSVFVGAKKSPTCNWGYPLTHL